MEKKGDAAGRMWGISEIQDIQKQKAMNTMSLLGKDNASAAIQLDPVLIGKMTQQGPRYTSYLTADRFNGSFQMGDYLKAVSQIRTSGSRNPLSLYIHIPFCESLCYYCGCNKIITKDHSKADTYLVYLKQEVEMQAALFASMNRVEQLHFGGGTPTFLSDAQMGDLVAHLGRSFTFASDAEGEFSIEIDPRTVDPERVHSLRAQGFNRISLGVQDFDEEVQKAVNRIQPEALTLRAIAAAREARFKSISTDLIYGLPKQTVMTMSQTLSKVIAADPDRISIYNYAHMPNLFKSQRLIADCAPTAIPAQACISPRQRPVHRNGWTARWKRTVPWRMRCGASSSRFALSASG
jgi:oxygen-independent coproporphyrinogen-3 oxidase